MRPLLLLLDEAGNIARIDNLDTLATSAAGTEIQLVTVFHDMAQIEALYGSDRANSIANNHSALMVLPGNRDPRTAFLLSGMGDSDIPELLGGKAIRRLAEGTALCLYRNLKAGIVELRSSTVDTEFEPVWEAAATCGCLGRLITLGARPGSLGA